MPCSFPAAVICAVQHFVAQCRLFCQLVHYFFFMDVVPNERVVEVAGDTFFTCENLQPSKFGVSYKNRTKESFMKLNYVLLWEERFGVRVHQTRGGFGADNGGGSP